LKPENFSLESANPKQPSTINYCDPMSISVSGTIERKALGPGTWALVTQEGETYELKDPPSELRKSALKVKVEGEVRKDVMSFAMIGPVLEVKSFEVLGS
jgi:hypothetical protein